MSNRTRQRSRSHPDGSASAFGLPPSKLSGPLLRWYAREHRKLPWRAEPGRLPDPYHVLVSETMLQQTQVATVIAYFHRFIGAFPTVRALADADEQRVLLLWQGLGYYQRARRLHAAAAAIVRDHAGRVPDTAQRLRALPGVGPYTAGAIASIAYGRPEPVVDGNVSRVLARVLAMEAPADRPAGRRQLWRAARELIDTAMPPPMNRVAHRPVARRGSGAPGPPPGRRKGGGRPYTAGDLNQALMELGARICTPRSPACPLCPLREGCRARRTGRPERYPRLSGRAAPLPVLHRIVAIRRGGRFLFIRRPDEGLWAGMWQLPTCESAAGGPDPHPRKSWPGARPRTLASHRLRGDDDQVRAAGNGNADTANAKPSATGLSAWVRRCFGVEVGPFRGRGGFEHRTTHRRIRFEVFEAEVRAGRLRPRAGQWRRIGAVDDLPLPNPQRRALRLLSGARYEPRP